VVVVRGDPAGWVGPVVVGIDGAPESAAAVEYAVSAAARRHVPLCALTAAPPVWTAPEAPIGATTPGVGALLGRMQEEALAPALKRHPDVPVEHRTVLAGAARALVDAGVGSGLLVLGTGGPAVLGSVGGHVLRHATCPVAVVPADWAPDRAAG
jgi:nucleotide-binding universal stress UspA family protein